MQLHGLGSPSTSRSKEELQEGQEEDRHRHLAVCRYQGQVQSMQLWHDQIHALDWQGQWRPWHQGPNLVRVKSQQLSLSLANWYEMQRQRHPQLPRLMQLPVQEEGSRLPRPSCGS